MARRSAAQLNFMKSSLLRKLVLLGISLAFSFYVQSLNLKAFSYFSDKPLFVEISTDWCYACKLLKPTVSELRSEYAGGVEFLFLNASNEDTVKEAQGIADDYGILEIFNNNKNAFPTVVILTPSGDVSKVILGANGKEAYKEALDNLIAGDFQIADEYNPARPEEANPPEITGNRPEEPVLTDRPQEPNFSDRPLEVSTSGRPPELTFWQAGLPIPYYAYFQFLVLPKCSSNNPIVCANSTGLKPASQQSGAPIFKPWDPNATRNEKGYSDVVKRG